MPVSSSSTSEERWAAWQARGVAHERLIRRRAAIIGALVLAAAVIAYALLSRSI